MVGDLREGAASCHVGANSLGQDDGQLAKGAGSVNDSAIRDVSIGKVEFHFAKADRQGGRGELLLHTDGALTEVDVVGVAVSTGFCGFGKHDAAIRHGLPHLALDALTAHTAEERGEDDADADEDHQHSQSNGDQDINRVDIQMGDQAQGSRQKADGPEPGKGGANEKVYRGDHQEQIPPAGEEEGKVFPGEEVQIIAQVSDAHSDDAEAEEEIGDFYNDIEMLKNADICAVPQGSPEEIKALADFVAVSCKDGAVADFIDYLTKIHSNLK